MNSPAMAAALAQIDREFGPVGMTQRFKDRIRGTLRAGPGHPMTQARYGARAHMLHGIPLERAAGLVDRWYRIELEAFQLASAIGSGSRLSSTVLRELRLILRWMRFKKMHGELANIRRIIAADKVRDVA